MGWIQHELEIRAPLVTPEIEAALLSSPGVQKELGQQQSDIAQLQRGAEFGDEIIRHALRVLGA